MEDTTAELSRLSIGRNRDTRIQNQPAQSRALVYFDPALLIRARIDFPSELFAAPGNSAKYAWAAAIAILGGHLKTGHCSTLQNRPPRAWRPRPSEFYLRPSSGRKSVCTLVRQLRGPHLSTCA